MAAPQAEASKSRDFDACSGKVARESWWDGSMASRRLSSKTRARRSLELRYEGAPELFLKCDDVSNYSRLREKILTIYLSLSSDRHDWLWLLAGQTRNT